MYVCMYVYIYIYIQREREREMYHSIVYYIIWQYIILYVTIVYCPSLAGRLRAGGRSRAAAGSPRVEKARGFPQWRPGNPPLEGKTRLGSKPESCRVFSSRESGVPHRRIHWSSGLRIDA